MWCLCWQNLSGIQPHQVQALLHNVSLIKRNSVHYHSLSTHRLTEGMMPDQVWVVLLSCLDFAEFHWWKWIFHFFFCSQINFQVWCMVQGQKGNVCVICVLMYNYPCSTIMFKTESNVGRNPGVGMPVGGLPCIMKFLINTQILLYILTKINSIILSNMNGNY